MFDSEQTFSFGHLFEIGVSQDFHRAIMHFQKEVIMGKGQQHSNYTILTQYKRGDTL